MNAFGEVKEAFRKRLWLPLLCVAALALRAGEPEPLKLIRAIALPDVAGRLDHLAIDVKGRRLFVAALGNNTVEVLDLNAGTRLRSITGCSKPQGLVYLPKPNLLFVANGGDGRVRIYDGASFKPVVTIGSLPDADNLRYDAKLDRVLVGYGDGGIGVINPVTGVLSVSIPLKGHPESFQLEQDGQYLFANVPGAQHIAVIDRPLRAVVETWPLKDARANFPMALDEGNHRLFVGCRNPARLIVLDAKDGKPVADLPISGDTDDLFYDGARRRIYVSCGEGFVDVIAQRDIDDYKPFEKIPTAPGARTCLFSLDLNRLYLAVPRRGDRLAEIRAYQAQP
jgi:DNA-binding beta-propeller fold protein YncE